MFSFRRSFRPLTVCSLGILGLTGYAADLTVSWVDNSSAETGFEIERSGDGVTFFTIANVGANVTSYVDCNLPTETAYWYRVRAFNDTSRSAYSNVTGSYAGTLGSTGNRSRLTNLSARAIPGPDDRSFIVGFVVGGGSRSVLLRGIGPGLSAFTASPTLADPKLSVRAGTTTLFANDNWGGSANLKALFSQFGAFSLGDSSKDAALSGGFTPGGYTALVDGDGGGIAMAEIFDADSSNSGARLMNLSVRAYASTGDGVLIIGFVIGGEVPLRVLIRAGGPVLAGLGVSTALADPQLDFYRGSALWEHNDDWGGSAALVRASEQTGAFAWSNTGSKDAAMTALLPPGAYTAIVSGVGGASGVALAEVYELP